MKTHKFPKEATVKIRAIRAFSIATPAGGDDPEGKREGAFPQTVVARARGEMFEVALSMADGLVREKKAEFTSNADVLAYQERELNRVEGGHLTDAELRAGVAAGEAA